MDDSSLEPSAVDDALIQASRLRLNSASLPLAQPETLHFFSTAADRAAEGLVFLLEAREYADDTGTDRWNFALEIGELRSVGLTKSDLRYLVLKGYVEHARETTLPGEATRSFHKSHGLTFSKRSCFVITEAGVFAARNRETQQLADSPVAVCETASPPSGQAQLSTSARRVVPCWDSDLQELRCNGLIVKRFKVPAPNQEMILAAFQEEGWPARIDDPLPPHRDQDPKRRLHDTIVSLNRNHKTRFLRFMGDGSGQGVRWTIVNDAPSEPE